jgi:hypothetical protein
MSDFLPHPLALELIARIGPHSSRRILELGCGRGRNTNALRQAGLDVEALPDDKLVPAPSLSGARFDGALSTHGFLHGTPRTIIELLRFAASALKPNAPLYATFASTRDARFGQGTQIDEQTFAPASGDENGVAHVYYDGAALRSTLQPLFEIDSLEEVNVDAIVGRWAHARMPSGTVHWFARVHRR